jgi:hypothetical protein
MSVFHRTVSASDLAAYVQLKRGDAPRGALLVRIVASGNAIACVFGNDNFGIERTRREVQLLRDYMRRMELREESIGLSQDGRSWAILVQVDASSCKTTAGRAFHVEMVRSCLEELVERAWKEADGASPETVLPGG